jgi:hypothetical protein
LHHAYGSRKEHIITYGNCQDPGFKVFYKEQYNVKLAFIVIIYFHNLGGLPMENLSIEFSMDYPTMVKSKEGKVNALKNQKILPVKVKYSHCSTYDKSWTSY